MASQREDMQLATIAPTQFRNQLFEGYGGAYVVALEGIVAVVDVDRNVEVESRRESSSRKVRGDKFRAG